MNVELMTVTFDIFVCLLTCKNNNNSNNNNNNNKYLNKERKIAKKMGKYSQILL